MLENKNTEGKEAQLLKAHLKMMTLQAIQMYCNYNTQMVPLAKKTNLKHLETFLMRMRRITLNTLQEV